MTKIVYHRGGGKSLGHSPNCLTTIKWALNHNAKAIEYDVVVAKAGDDHKIIVIEPKLLADNHLYIDNLEWSDVQKLDAGNEKYGNCKISLLEEVLETVNGKCHQQIHIKGNNPKTVSQLLSELKNSTNYSITSFDKNILGEVKKLNPGCKVGWIVKPTVKAGNEGVVDMTKKVSENPNSLPSYSTEELESIKLSAKEYNIDIIILCGPRIKAKNSIEFFQNHGFEVGAWGIATNLELAKKLISFKIDRFTIDNPEEIHL